MKKLFVVILGSREFKGKTGNTFAALSMLNVVSGKFIQTTATAEALITAGIEGPSETEIVCIDLEADELRSKVVGFHKTEGVYTVHTMTEAELPKV